MAKQQSPRKAKKKKRVVKLPAHYSDLRVPIFIWNQVWSTNDLSWLLVHQRKLKKGEDILLAKVWEGINNAYIKEFGLSETFIEVMRKRLKIAILKAEWCMSQDDNLFTLVEIAELELKRMTQTEVKGDYMKTLTLLEARLKFQIDEHKTSVHKFYSYFKTLN